jgi:hypothetical protein
MKYAFQGQVGGWRRKVISDRISAIRKEESKTTRRFTEKRNPRPRHTRRAWSTRQCVTRGAKAVRVNCYWFGRSDVRQETFLTLNP